MKREIFTLALSLTGIVFSNFTAADSGGTDSEVTLCPSTLNIPARPQVDATLAADDMQLSADEADLVEKGISVLQGNAEITRNTQQVRADRIEYDSEQDNAQLYGDVHYWDEGLFLHSDEANLEFDNGTGVFNKAEYILKDSRAKGNADVLTLDIGTKTELEGANYTTCEPDDKFWQLSASKISLDHVESWGTARNVVLRIKNVPVFYTPYMSFPLSKKRKTGFLTPGYGSTKRNGLEFRTPFYWNISPTMDATITPRFLTDNGLMMMGEYRYLLRRGQGNINLEYLPSDNNFADQDRSLFGFKHKQTFLDTGKLDLIYNRVSDKSYFEDFGSQLSLTSTRYLERRADVSYSDSLWNGGSWNLTTRVQDYQTVDRSIPSISRPYKRLPQVLFNARSPSRNHSLNYGIDSEFVYFDRGDSADVLNDVNGLRIDMEPYISYPVNTVSSYLEPRLGVRYTQYSLSDPGTFTNSPSRLLPVVSLDGGLFLERELNLFGKGYFQTLEPRLYYLYIPKENQNDLPVFDTGLYTFSFDSLFRRDRFSGPDRMGDANQITLALTSYLNDAETGRDIGYISVGQIYYLRDRDVILPTGQVRDEDSSPIVAEIGTKLIKHWTVRGDIQWDPNGNGTEKLTAQLRYNPEPGKILNLAYRVRQDVTDIEQSDISFRWPLARNWSVVGRWNYAVPEGRSLETFAGIEYESCCWGVRAVARRFLTSIDGEFETGVFLQMELKGLAGIGKKTVDFLQQQIPGYKSEF